MTLVYVRGENGLLCGIWEESVLPDGIRHRLERGDLARITEDGHPWPGDEDEVPDEPPEDAPELPRRNESRQAWEDFAVSQGMDADEAAGMTKAELVTEFTRPRIPD